MKYRFTFDEAMAFVNVIYKENHVLYLVPACELDDFLAWREEMTQFDGGSPHITMTKEKLNAYNEYLVKGNLHDYWIFECASEKKL